MLRVESPETMVMVIQDEIRRNQESRYEHRLHAALLVAQGISCQKVSEVFGDSPRTVQYWIRRFNESGLSGLYDAPISRRPGRLSECSSRK